MGNLTSFRMVWDKFLDRAEQSARLRIEFRAERKFGAFVDIGP